MQHLTDAVAPLEGIFSVVIQQAEKLTVAPKHKVCALRIGHGKVQVARRAGDKWHVVMKGKCSTGQRNILVVAGRATPTLPVQLRAGMSSLGFTLKHVP